jgi:serine/threonine protein kinase
MLIKSQPVTDEYELGIELGIGSYGVVYRDLSNRYAIKQIDSEFNMNIFMEFLILKQFINQPNIARIQSAHCVYGGKNWVTSIVLDQYDMPLNYWKSYNMNPQKVIYIMRGIASAIYTMHEHGFLHLDIKPANILVSRDGNDVRLIDFGISTHIGRITHKQPWSTVVTLWYRPPEILNKESYDHTVDVWSLGCVFGELVYGTALYPGSTKKELRKLHIKTDISKLSPVLNMHQWTILVQDMLTKNPISRLSISDVLNKLNCPVDAIEIANMKYLTRNCHTITPVIKPRRLDYINDLLEIALKYECRIKTIIHAIAAMDYFDKLQARSLRTIAWLATIEQLY